MKKLLLASILLVSWAPTAFAASTVYVAQAAAGSDDGTSCANAHAATFFNTAGNWGLAPTQIGPGTTVHLCGTITTPLTVQGSGSAGSPITVLWETNAKISLPTCSTICFNMNGKSFITLDGGTNGIIEATANGTLFANHVDIHGIDCRPCPNAEIKNLAIRNLYVVTMPDNPFGGGASIYLNHTSNSNISIHHNTFSKSFKGVIFQLAGSEVNNTIYTNTFTNQAWPIVYGSGNSGVSASGITIHDNDITAGSNWCGDNGTGSVFHLDPIHLWAVQSSVTITGIQIYNNYIHGDMCTGNTTAGIYLESFTGNNVVSQIYNNLIVATAGSFTNGSITPQSEQGTIVTEIFNNTVACNVGGRGIYFEGPNNVNLKIENNIIVNCDEPIYVDTPSPNPFSLVDYNDYYNWGNGFHWGTNFYSTLAGWRGACACDSHATASNPNLNANNQPNSGSPVIQAATNLTGLGISALDFDKAGVARPASGAWDIGAFAFSARPSPPTNLTVR